MRAKLLRTALPALLLGAAFALPAAAQMPDARGLMDRHLQAAGGRDALLAAANAKVVATFALPSVGLSGPMEMYTSNGKLFSKISLAGLGDLMSGYDGQVAWGMDPMQGPRIMSGVERDQMLEQADPLATVRDASRFRSAETVGEETLGGVACWSVKLVWTSGRETFDCYAKDTGLLHATRSITTSPMGQIPTTTLMLDYADFGAIKSPRRMVSEASGQEYTITIQQMEIGVQPELVFLLPAEIEALKGS